MAGKILNFGSLNIDYVYSLDHIVKVGETQASLGYQVFEGGKGLAAFGGLILAYSPKMFLAIVTTGIILMFVCNTGVVAPFMGCLAFPVMVYYSSHDLLETIGVLTASCIIFSTHLSNFKMAKRREDVVNTTDFVEKVFKKKK